MPASHGWGHRTEPGLGFSAFPLERFRPWVEPGAVLPAPRQALGSVLGFSMGCEGLSRSCISWEPAAASDFGAQSPATLSCGSQTFHPGGFPRRSWGRLRGCVAPWKQPGAVGFFSGVVAKARGESARIKSRWTEQTPAGCCAGAVPLHQPISISALPAWLLRAINQSRQQLLYPQRAVGPRGCRFPAPRGSPAWRWLEGKGGSGAKRVGEGLPKRVTPSPLHLHVPKTERLWARWPWGRSHPGDEAPPSHPRAAAPRGARPAQSVRLSFLPRELFRQPLHHGRREVRLHAPRGLPLRREQRPQLPGEPPRAGRHRGRGGFGVHQPSAPGWAEWILCCLL